MFVKGVNFYFFYYLCYDMDICTDMLKDQVLEEIDMDLNKEEDIILYTIR